MPAKTRELRFSPRALRDLEEIWLYTFEKWSLSQAESYVSDISSACKGLAKGDRVGVNADYVRGGYLKYFSGAHTIYYTVSEQYLYIIRVLHQSRDVEKALIP